MSENVITVSGASDDLIEVDGALSEEFCCPSSGAAYLAFSNGVLLHVRYDDEGKWRIRPLKGQSRVTVEFAPEDEKDGYTDRAHLHEAAAWVVFGASYADAHGLHEAEDAA